jgi:hypothetical protein
MWAGFTTLEYVNYILWVPGTNMEYSLFIRTFNLNLDTLVELYPQHYAHDF